MDMKNLFSPCERQREWGRRGSTQIEIQTGEEEKSDYPLIHCFKEVNLIKIVVMKTLKAPQIIKPHANSTSSVLIHRFFTHYVSI